jgi:hypothetical protein
MNFDNLLKLLKCPPKQDGQLDELGQCLTALGTSNEQLGNAQAALGSTQAELKEANNAIAVLTQNLQECHQGSGAELLAVIKERDELLKLSNLLTEGPDVPDQSKVRWLPLAYIDALLTTQLGTKYTQCTSKHYSEDNYVVCSKWDMEQFIQYYAMFWMPHIKYVTQQWKKLNGSQVEIWMNDCDNYSDFFKGLPAINPNWACFPWGQVWAEVEGWMSGGHAFNILVCCDDTYNETSIAGLHAYLLEPQMAGGGLWPAARPVGYVLRELKEVAGFFQIKGTMWMVKF